MTKDRLKVTEKLYKEKPQIENTGFAVCRNFPYSHFASFWWSLGLPSSTIWIYQKRIHQVDIGTALPIGFGIGPVMYTDLSV